MISSGLNIYVVGYGGEKFADNSRVFYTNLKEWTSLLNHTNCKLCLTTLSGPASLMVIFNNKISKNTIIDLSHERCHNPKDRLNLDMINFKNIHVDYVNSNNLKDLINYLGI